MAHKRYTELEFRPARGIIEGELRNVGAAIYRTDENGAVTVATDGAATRVVPTLVTPNP